MIKRIKYTILSIGMIASFGLAALPANTGAVSVMPDVCKDGSAANTALCRDWNKDKAGSFVSTLVNILLGILAAVSVIVIIFAGIFYVTSMGSSESVKKARETLMYAVVGLIVAILAYAIVNFVLKNFIKFT